MVVWLVDLHSCDCVCWDHGHLRLNRTLSWPQFLCLEKFVRVASLQSLPFWFLWKLFLLIWRLGRCYLWWCASHSWPFASIRAGGVGVDGFSYTFHKMNKDQSRRFKCKCFHSEEACTATIKILVDRSIISSGQKGTILEYTIINAIPNGLRMSMQWLWALATPTCVSLQIYPWNELRHYPRLQKGNVCLLQRRMYSLMPSKLYVMMLTTVSVKAYCISKAPNA